MSKKKILKFIGVILLVVLVIFLMHTIRNYSIINNLQNKLAKYSDSTNYHIRVTTVSDRGITSEINYYKKDNKQITIMERNIDN